MAKQMKEKESVLVGNKIDIYTNTFILYLTKA